MYLDEFPFNTLKLKTWLVFNSALALRIIPHCWEKDLVCSKLHNVPDNLWGPYYRWLLIQYSVWGNFSNRKVKELTYTEHVLTLLICRLESLWQFWKGYYCSRFTVVEGRHKKKKDKSKKLFQDHIVCKWQGQDFFQHMHVYLPCVQQMFLGCI